MTHPLAAAHTVEAVATKAVGVAEHSPGHVFLQLSLFFSLSLFIYIYIYRERERESWRKAWPGPCSATPTALVATASTVWAAARGWVMEQDGPLLCWLQSG